MPNNDCIRPAILRSRSQERHMARMEKQDIKKYSDLASWLLYELPNLPYYKPKVWTAFTRHAGMLAGYSIMWGFNPVIKVDAGQMLECKETGAPQRQKD